MSNDPEQAEVGGKWSCPNWWSCPNCKLKNSPTRTYCWSCHVPRGDHPWLPMALEIVRGAYGKADEVEAMELAKRLSAYSKKIGGR